MTKSIFVTSNNLIEISISFIDLLNCLPDNFVQIAKSYIINKDFIISINDSKKTILFQNNSLLKYSNKFINNLGDDFLCKL